MKKIKVTSNLEIVFEIPKDFIVEDDKKTELKNAIYKILKSEIGDIFSIKLDDFNIEDVN